MNFEGSLLERSMRLLYNSRMRLSHFAILFLVTSPAMAQSNNEVFTLYRNSVLEPSMRIHVATFDTELLSNLVFELCWSCCDLAGFGDFNTVFERDACDDFGEVVKAA